MFGCTTGGFGSAGGRNRHGFGRSHHHGGGPFGRGHFGPPGRPHRFGRGDLKYVMLDMLQSGPRHGYDIIQELESRSHGFYSPSPGSVYPALQLLEDQGYVTSSQQDGKRVYAITDAGRNFLVERASTVDDVRARMAAGWGARSSPELRELMDEARQIGQILFTQATHGALGDAEKVRRLREAVARARQDIESIFTGTGGPTGPVDHV